MYSYSYIRDLGDWLVGWYVRVHTLFNTVDRVKKVIRGGLLGFLLIAFIGVPWGEVGGWVICVLSTDSIKRCMHICMVHGKQRLLGWMLRWCCGSVQKKNRCHMRIMRTNVYQRYL